LGTVAEINIYFQKTACGAWLPTRYKTRFCIGSRHQGPIASGVLGGNMSRIARVGKALGLAVLLTSSVAAMAPDAAAVGEKAFADMKLRDGRDIGRIKLVETTAGILIRLKLKGLPSGAHGFHIHENGKCEGDFESAGGILNPLGAKHGYLNDEGPMMGDLPNLIVPSSGEIEVDLVSAFATMAKDAEDTLIDSDGAAFVIFERPDDYMTDPIGNAGARIACGVITAHK
jgi:superoxide dismutase, Cu-Zn family